MLIKGNDTIAMISINMRLHGNVGAKLIDFRVIALKSLSTVSKFVDLKS